MSTFTQILYQIVFSTKHRAPVMDHVNRQKLYKYMYGVLNNNNCHSYRINGIEDHLHIITHVHPSIALSDLIKDLKISSSRFIKANNLFKNFNAWQEGYGAFTYSIEAKETLINYVINQKEHHKTVSSIEELKTLFKEHHIEYDERYLI